VAADKIPTSTAQRRRILVAEDDEANAGLLIALLERDGYEVLHAGDGEGALAATTDRLPDLVLLDVMMPKMDGFEVCRRIKSQASTRLIPVILVTGLGDRHARIEGIDAGADEFLSKPFDGLELRARVRSLLRAKSYVDELDSAEAVIMSLALTIEARDPYTDRHCQRLAVYATEFGEQLGLDPTHIEALRKGGFLHDLGKIGVPDAILLKPGPLTADEFAVMQQHPITGDRLCGELRALRSVRPIVRHHHETLNGQGYPDRLQGSEVPILAQIMGIVDTYDALTSTRPYRTARTASQAFEQLEGDVKKGRRDGVLVTEFIALVESGAFSVAQAG
jgi:putative two-component system response regulator